LFIIGLPRTGTTILHALLDVDTANRSPLFWEVEFPVPPANPSTWLVDPRIAKNQKMLDQLDKICPGFNAVHPMAADMPQECVAIFAYHMMSEHFHMTFNVPSYIEWLDDQDMRPSYRLHKAFLQHLQSGGVKGKRWLLKSPCHLHLIDQLLDIYPDANIIHTHRDPVSVCASITSLAAMLRGVGSDHIDTHAIARQQLDWWEKLLQRAVSQRKALEHKSAQFFDLKMSETVSDPLGSVERIYQHFNLPLGDDVKQQMLCYMQEHPRDKHGSHSYQPEDFGISKDRDTERFREYIDYFGL
ncbi:MAG: sulfotransferase, partial [Pseudomonadales bacterium]|nr:sulfotransferase [Pseudomonadales bacterium]